MRGSPFGAAAHGAKKNAACTHETAEGSQAWLSAHSYHTYSLFLPFQGKIRIVEGPGKGRKNDIRAEAMGARGEIAASPPPSPPLPAHGWPSRDARTWSEYLKRVRFDERRRQHIAPPKTTDRGRERLAASPPPSPPTEAPATELEAVASREDAAASVAPLGGEGSLDAARAGSTSCRSEQAEEVTVKGMGEVEEEQGKRHG